MDCSTSKNIDSIEERSFGPHSMKKISESRLKEILSSQEFVSGYYFYGTASRTISEPMKILLQRIKLSRGSIFFDSSPKINQNKMNTTSEMSIQCPYMYILFAITEKMPQYILWKDIHGRSQDLFFKKKSYKDFVKSIRRGRNRLDELLLPLTTEGLKTDRTVKRNSKHTSNSNGYYLYHSKNISRDRLNIILEKFKSGSHFYKVLSNDSRTILTPEFFRILNAGYNIPQDSIFNMTKGSKKTTYALVALRENSSISLESHMDFKDAYGNEYTFFAVEKTYEEFSSYMGKRLTELCKFRQIIRSEQIGDIYHLKNVTQNRLKILAERYKTGYRLCLILSTECDSTLTPELFNLLVPGYSVSHDNIFNIVTPSKKFTYALVALSRESTIVVRSHVKLKDDEGKTHTFFFERKTYDEFIEYMSNNLRKGLTELCKLSRRKSTEGDTSTSDNICSDTMIWPDLGNFNDKFRRISGSRLRSALDVFRTGYCFYMVLSDIPTNALTPEIFQRLIQEKSCVIGGIFYLTLDTMSTSFYGRRNRGPHRGRYRGQCRDRYYGESLTILYQSAIIAVRKELALKGHASFLLEHGYQTERRFTLIEVENEFSGLVKYMRSIRDRVIDLYLSPTAGMSRSYVRGLDRMSAPHLCIKNFTLHS